MSNSNLQPFSIFGSALKRLRENHSKSQAEVSGAVEIEQQKLQDYEAGKQRPTEDILLLLIQHFDLRDDEADELWRLAGYNDISDEAQYFSNDGEGVSRQTKTIMISPQDARIVYTDMVQVMVNNYGVIINFMQSAGINDKPLAAARVGMSKEHARSVVEVLRKTLEQADDMQAETKKPRQLPTNTQQQE